MHTDRVFNMVEDRTLDLELYFVTEILKLRSLHYGYWDEPPRQVSLDDVRQAQARFTERLLALIPNGVRTILDIGSGIGENARALTAAGYVVTAISPNNNHPKYYGPGGTDNITFHNLKFEDFESAGHFDLILISEALNYFDHEFGLHKFRRLLIPGGHLLITGMFSSSDSAPFAHNFPVATLPYVRLAAAHGFSLLHAVDITQNVLPTMTLTHDAIQSYVRPAVALMERYLAASAPWKLRLLKVLFGGRIREAQHILTYYERRVDPHFFSTRMRYATLLLRGHGAVSAAA